MGILNKLKPSNIIKTAFNKQMKDWLKGVGNNMYFDPTQFSIYKNIDENRDYNVELITNLTWYRGDPKELAFLYGYELGRYDLNGVDPLNQNLTINTDILNYFWYKAASDTESKKYHTGLPSLIAKKMPDLIMGNGYDINIESSASDEDNDRLNYILNENNFNTLLRSAMETESWGGGVAFKISFHNKFDYPIIEVIQPDNYTSTVIAGKKIIEDIFYKIIQRNNITYRFSEIYGTDDGGSYIKYRLEKKTKNADKTDWKEIELNELPEFSNYEDIYIPGMTEKLSIYKPNKLPNKKFRGSIFGESDFAGAHGAFDQLDLIYSIWAQETEDARLMRYFPFDILEYDPEDGYSKLPAQLKKDHIMYSGGIAKDGENTKIEYLQGDIHVDNHVASFNKSLELALNIAGLSPITIGITGFEAPNTGQDSQRERKETSARTSEYKKALWIDTLNSFIPILLQADDIRNIIYNKTELIYEPVDYKATVSFGDYILTSFKDRLEEVKLGLESETMPYESRVKHLFKNMTEEQIDEIIQSGIVQFNITIEDNKNQLQDNTTQNLKQIESNLPPGDPLPKPNPNESKDVFIQRFMSDEMMKKEYPDDKQRLAVANKAFNG